MTCDGYTRVWELAPREIVRLDGARGTTLRVTRGCVWLTQERDTRDIILDAGDTFTIERGGRTLLEAQGDASVCVLAHYVAAARGGRRRSHATRARAWLRWIRGAVRGRRWAPYF